MDLPKIIGGLISDFASSFAEHFLSICICAAIIAWLALLLPDIVFEFLEISELRTSNLQWIGLVAYLSPILVFFIIARKLAIYGMNRTQEARQRQKLTSKITPVECEYLNKYIASETQTMTFDLYDGVVDGLIKKGVLYKADTKANKAGEQDYNIHPWAYEYLYKNSHLITSKIVDKHHLEN